MSVEMFTRKINLISDVSDTQLENLNSLVAEALSTLRDTYYQPPHWDHEPTAKEKKAENQYLEESIAAEMRVKEIAANIYLALTGEVIQ
jgi:hypothetical protein